jgi:hypothetical protein
MQQLHLEHTSQSARAPAGSRHRRRGRLLPRPTSTPTHQTFASTSSTTRHTRPRRPDGSSRQLRAIEAAASRRRPAASRSRRPSGSTPASRTSAGGEASTVEVASGKPDLPSVPREHGSVRRRSLAEQPAARLHDAGAQVVVEVAHVPGNLVEDRGQAESEVLAGPPSVAVGDRQTAQVRGGASTTSRWARMRWIGSGTAPPRCAR